MPTYDYVCPECKHVYTITHSLKDENKRECDKCKTELRKKFSSTAVVFRGDGFYTTDKFTDR